jgi:hypothetical protein
MRVPHYAMRPLAVVALIGLMTGCGGNDSTAPDAPFDPAGTSSDIDAIEASYESDAMYGFQSAMPAISTTLGESSAAVALRAAPSKIMATGKSGAREYASTLARLYSVPTAGMRPVGSRAAILEEHLGKTFVRNASTLEYEVSDRTGAPSNGVRFIVYTVNPISGQPVTPLQEVGYVQLTDLSGSTTQAARVLVVSGDITYLDYTVTAMATTAGGLITVAGYVTDGATRANVNLRSTVNQTAGLTMLYSIDVPQRDVSIDLTMSTTGLDPETATFGIDLGMSGPNGTVSMSGQFTATGGTIVVRVNGDVFANITSEGPGEPIITGADGQPLTAEDQATFQNIFALTGEAFITFDVMLLPIGFFLAPTT